MNPWFRTMSYAPLEGFSDKPQAWASPEGAQQASKIRERSRSSFTLVHVRVELGSCFVEGLKGSQAFYFRSRATR